MRRARTETMESEEGMVQNELEMNQPSVRKRSRQQMEPMDDESVMAPLPPLNRTSDPWEQVQLLLRKLRQCQRLFQFDDDDPAQSMDPQRRERAEKTEALRQLNEFVAANGECFAALMGAVPELGMELFRTVECNLFRALPPCACPPEPDPDDMLPSGSCSPASSACARPTPAWPHLQLIWRLLRRLLDSGAPIPSLLAPHINARFCALLLDTLRSGDPRERAESMRALHAVYSRWPDQRAGMRTRMANALLEHTFERAVLSFHGLSELLQLLGDIIDGFNVPLKPEHRQFLLRVLLPLHRSPSLPRFFPQLANCVVLFVEKERALAEHAVHALLRHWPRECSARQVLFLAELEEMLPCLAPQSPTSRLPAALFRRLALSASGPHARIAERALQLCVHPGLLALLRSNAPRALPVLVPALCHASRTHWSASVVAMALKTLGTLNGELELLTTETEEEKPQRRKKELTMDPENNNISFPQQLEVI